MSPYKILVIEYLSKSKELETMLNKLDFQAITLFSESLDINKISNEIMPEVIVFNSEKVTDKMIQFIKELNLVYARPTILFSEDSDSKSVNKVIQAGISAYIVNGLESKRIKNIIDIAAARFKEQQQLKAELEKTRDKLEERKLVDRAKGILIKTRGFSEDEAYHTIRKLAMDRNIALAEMAKNVIAMSELLEL
ncbi:response regulator receiver protein [Methyloprofundus sedimenti]|uniref:Response regulator receiver protein n=1 Tax=Methyloprofundus sedimenti TaxID=1420851 RepID=A0A1V8M7C2_9GAMM|nr:ANTAR domain-containing protein [Methyloprofundus sedimenti]OQK17439.1 response regulator receiver protein [Methyloprofundus sedimenti]